MSAIPRLLPNLFIIDVLADDQFRYRYMGTRNDEHLGVNLTGKLFSEARSGQVLTEITAFFSRIATEGLLGLLITRLPSERFEWVRYMRLGLPVADDHETVNKIAGLFLFEADKSSPFRMPSISDVDTSELGEVARLFGELD